MQWSNHAAPHGRPPPPPLSHHRLSLCGSSRAHSCTLLASSWPTLGPQPNTPAHPPALGVPPNPALQVPSMHRVRWPRPRPQVGPALRPGPCAALFSVSPAQPVASQPLSTVTPVHTTPRYVCTYDKQCRAVPCSGRAASSSVQSLARRRRGRHDG